MTNHDKLNEFVSAAKDALIISDATPLLSNITVGENIAIVKEAVYGAKSATNEVLNYLEKFGVAYITNLRVEALSKHEIAIAMLIRAQMHSSEKLIVLAEVFDMDKIDEIAFDLFTKEILILDVDTNKALYKGIVSGL